MMTQNAPTPRPTTSTSAWAAAPNAEQEMRERDAASQGGLWNPLLTPLVLIWTAAAIAIAPVSQMRVLTTIGVPQAMVICLLGAVVHSAAFLMGYGILRMTKTPPTGAAIVGLMPLIACWILALT